MTSLCSFSCSVCSVLFSVNMFIILCLLKETKNIYFTCILSYIRYRGIVQGKWYRHFCCLIVSSFQMMGAIVYMGAEWHVGFIHLPAHVSYSLGFV